MNAKANKELRTVSTVIRIKNLDYVVPSGKKILDNISFSIEMGEFVAIVGHNGAGKSSLIQHLNGLIKPKKDQVQVVELDPSEVPTSKLSQYVGFLFQNPDHQIFNNSVRAEIIFGLKNMGYSSSEMELRVKLAAEQVGLAEKLEEYPFRLSRGYRQRLAFASVLAMDPEILVLDEPTTGQDFKESQQIMEMVARRNREGKTILMITHDMDLVHQYAQRVIVLAAGKIIADGPAAQILLDKEILNKAGLLQPSMVRLSQGLMNSKLNINGENEQEIFAEIQQRLRKLGVA